MSIDFSSVKSWNIPEGEVLSASLNGVQVWEKQSPTPTPAITADVTFIDYDGTILYEYTAADFLNLSALPATVNHTSLGDGLGAGSWNWSLSGAKTQVQNCGKVIIGQTCEILVPQAIKDKESYTTSSNMMFSLFFENVDNDVKLCYLPLTLNSTTSSPFSNTMCIDWGDGDVSKSVYQSAYSYAQKYTHNYTNSGDYTVSVSSYVYYPKGTYYCGVCVFPTGSSPSYNYTAIQYEPTDNSTDNDIYYRDRVTKMYIGEKFGLFVDTTTYNKSVDQLNNFINMKSINLRAKYKVSSYYGPNGTILNGATSLVAYVSPNALRAYSYGSNYRTANYLSNTPSLKVLSLSYGSDAGTDSTNATVEMCNNSGIEQIYLTYNFQKITNSFNSCSNLREAILPCGSNSNTVKIDGCFKDCSALQTLKFTSTKSSSMYNITNYSFQNLPTTCKIYVPSAKMADYKALSGMPDPTVYEYIGY